MSNPTQSGREAARQAAQEAAREARAAAQEAVREARQAAEEARREAQEAITQARIQAEIDAASARTEGAGPVIVQEPPFPPFGPGSPVPQEAVVIFIAFFVMCAVMAIGIPLARAFARRMDRRGAVDPNVAVDTRARLERIEHAVDAIAVEVERISEGQRYTTKILSEVRALPEPNPLEANAAAALRRVREAR